MRTDPAAGALIPAIRRPSVDFPAPEGPTIATVDVQRHAVQHFLAVAVGKMHAFDVQGGVEPAGGIRSRRLRPFDRTGVAGGVRLLASFVAAAPVSARVVRAAYAAALTPPTPTPWDGYPYTPPPADLDATAAAWTA